MLLSKAEVRPLSGMCGFCRKTPGHSCVGLQLGSACQIRPSILYVGYAENGTCRLFQHYLLLAVIRRQRAENRL